MKMPVLTLPSPIAGFAERFACMAAPDWVCFCATSVFSVPLWWPFLEKQLPQRHGEHRDRTEEFKLKRLLFSGGERSFRIV